MLQLVALLQPNIITSGAVGKGSAGLLLLLLLLLLVLLLADDDALYLTFISGSTSGLTPAATCAAKGANSVSSCHQPALDASSAAIAAVFDTSICQRCIVPLLMPGCRVDSRAQRSMAHSTTRQGLSHTMLSARLLMWGVHALS